MMSQRVMAIGDPDFAIGAGGAFVSHQESDDASQVRLERDGDHVASSAGVMFGEIGRYAIRFFPYRD